MAPGAFSRYPEGCLSWGIMQTVEMDTMMKYLLVATVIALSATVADAADSKKTRFWNLVSETVSKFELAPAGTTNWGPDQCKNDKDGAVDHDERLTVIGVRTGTYDARLGFAGGRLCYAKNIRIEEGKVFSIEDKQLIDCSSTR